jgi:hypothetical protein
MSSQTVRPPFDQFLATAEAVARERPEVDLELAREIFQEAATMLDNSLALDGLDEHDASAVVAGLCIDLVAADPGAAIRARAQHTLDSAADVHDAQVCPGRTCLRPRSSSSKYRVSDWQCPGSTLWMWKTPRTLWIGASRIIRGRRARAAAKPIGPAWVY